mgnify:FL=1
MYFGKSNDACATPSQYLIGCITLSQEYWKLIYLYLKIMRRQLETLKCPIIVTRCRSSTSSSLSAWTILERCYYSPRITCPGCVLMNILKGKQGFEVDFFKKVCAEFTRITLHLSKAWSHNLARIWVYLATYLWYTGTVTTNMTLYKMLCKSSKR